MSPEEAVKAVETGEFQGYNPTWVRERASLMKLTPKCRAAFDSGELCATNAYTLAKQSPERQEEILKEACEIKPEFFVPRHTK